MARATILVVDEDETIRLILTQALRLNGYQPVATASAEEALFLLTENAWLESEVDLLLADMELPGISGLELVDELRHRGRRVPTIVMSATNGKEAVSGAVVRRCVGYFPKPFRLSSLLGAIGACLACSAETRKAEEALESLMEALSLHSQV